MTPDTCSSNAVKHVQFHVSGQVCLGGESLATL